MRLIPTKRILGFLYRYWRCREAANANRLINGYHIQKIPHPSERLDNAFSFPKNGFGMGKILKTQIPPRSRLIPPPLFPPCLQDDLSEQTSFQKAETQAARLKSSAAFMASRRT